MRKLLLVVALILMPTMASASTFKATGYYPFTCKKSERVVEGGIKDRFGNKLRTLQDYYDGSYVSVATDPRAIKSGTILEIEEFPNVKFLACDVGRKIKGRRIDIAVKRRKDAYALPQKVTVKIITNEKTISHFLTYLNDNLMRLFFKGKSIALYLQNN